VKIPHIGLVNVVAGREVAPEFVQSAVTPVALADALEPLLTPGSRERALQVRDLANVADRLGTPGAAERVARIVSDLAR
jgi:lipid-A-disaccharide synthase